LLFPIPAVNSISKNPTFIPDYTMTFLLGMLGYTKTHLIEKSQLACQILICQVLIQMFC
jgi:hypothetical protein